MPHATFASPRIGRTGRHVADGVHVKHEGVNQLIHVSKQMRDLPFVPRNMQLQSAESLKRSPRQNAHVRVE